MLGAHAAEGGALQYTPLPGEQLYRLPMGPGPLFLRRGVTSTSLLLAITGAWSEWGDCSECGGQKYRASLRDL